MRRAWTDFVAGAVRGRAAARLAFAAAGAAGLGAGAPAAAQVIAIGEAGETTVYDRPTVFTARSARPVRDLRPRQASPGRGSGPPPPPPLGLVAAADAADLGAELVEAVAWVESRGRACAVSPAGALGEMQLMPGTARALGVDPRDSRQNYRGGAAYLRALLSRFDGDLVLTLAAYNAGPAAVDRHHGVPPFKETRAYVAAVLDRLGRRGASPADGASER